MAVKSKPKVPQGTYFDLEGARRVASALSAAFTDSGSFSLGMAPHRKQKDSVVLYATDGQTEAAWCEDESFFDASTVMTVNKITPALLSPAVFGSDAFLKQDGDISTIMVDNTICSKLSNSVRCETEEMTRLDVRLPSGQSPCSVLYSARLTTLQDIIPFLAGLGMLYGFGDKPALTFNKGKIEGITTGTMPGMFECTLPSITCAVDNLHIQVPRAFCYVVLNMLLAARINEIPKDVFISVFDETAAGTGLSLYVKCGACCIWSKVTETTRATWSAYMPLAYIDSVPLPGAEAALMFTAIASTLLNERATITAPVKLTHQQGVGISAVMPGSNIRVYCDAPTGSLPDFEVWLTRNQLVALSYAVGAVSEDTAVELLLGDDDEIFISMDVAESWVIRIR